ncbi:ABC transporter permease [Spirochaetia bacterium]|nr:ABC transporter permease [Spirochaetia bacterium]
MPELLQKYTMLLIKPVGTILIALMIGVLLIIPTDTSPWEAYSVLFYGAFGSPANFANTLARSTPFLFTGLAAAFAFRAGVFNIGIEGQMYLGALCAALMGVKGSGLPGFLLIPLCLLAAMVGGLLWSFVPGFLKAKFNINIVIVSIMMNNIAILFTSYLSTYPFKGELPIGATGKIAAEAMLPRLGNQSELNFGFIIGLLAAMILYIVIFRTRFGYEMRAFGLNERFTRYMGVDLVKKTLLVLFISGVLAGLAGAEQVMGVNYRFISNFSTGYGFTGITVALLGRLNPLGIIIGAIFFGAMNTGAVQMEVMTSISRDLISSLQAVMILFLAAEYFIKLPKWKLLQLLPWKKAEKAHDGLN